MERPADIDEVRRRAIDFVRDMLEKVGCKRSGETASSIVELTFERPLKEVFLIATTNDRIPSATPVQSLKAKGSRGFLRLGRRESKSCSSGSKATVFVKNTVPMNSSFPVFERPGGAVGPVQYSCIICEDDLSSKGVCKRHLDEQHVSPKQYNCEKCNKQFLVKSEARKHSDRCGAGVFSFTVRRRDDKKIYGCEFTGECFLSRPKYLEHLLSLCEKGGRKPDPDLRRKLCGLLAQPNLRQHVSEISIKSYGSRHAWRKLQWTDVHISKAIEQLEYAVVHDSGTIDLGRNADGSAKLHNTRVYLNSLFSAATLPLRRPSVPSVEETERRGRTALQAPQRSPSSGTDSGSVTPTACANGAIPLDQGPHGAEYIISTVPCLTVGSSAEPSNHISTEVKGKRHLSDQSRFYVPLRRPPGPPVMPDIPRKVSATSQGAQYAKGASTSVTTLPIRNQEVHCVARQLAGSSLDQTQDYASSGTGSMLSMCAPSNATLMSSYQEHEAYQLRPFDYNPWMPQQSATNTPNYFSGNVDDGLSGAMYCLPDYLSVGASSMATDQTYVGEYVDLDPKLPEYCGMSPNPMMHSGTFYFDGDDDQYEIYGID